MYFTRSHIGVDGRAELARRPNQWKNTESKTVKLWKLASSVTRKPLADPTRVIRDPSKWKTPKVLKPEEFEKICIDLTILIEDQDAYRERFARKLNIFDEHHFGLSPTTWSASNDQAPNTSKLVARQKFTENLQSVRPGPYREIEENYLDEYFQNTLDQTQWY